MISVLGTIRRLLAYLIPYWALMVLGFFLILLGTGTNLTLPWIVGMIIDQALEGGQAHLLMPLIIGLFVVTALKGGLTFAQTYSLEYVSQKVIYDLRTRLYNHLQHLPFSFFDKAQTGQLMSRMTQDVNSLHRFLGWGLLQVLTNAILFFGILVMLLMVNWRLTLVSLAVTPVLLVTVIKFRRKVRPAFRAIQAQIAELSTTLQETLSGIRVVRAFAREDRELEKFDQENTKFFEKSVEAARLWAKFSPRMTFLTGLASILVLWYGGREVILGRLTLGVMVAFHAYLFMLIGPIRMMGWLINLLERATASGERIFEILDTKSEIIEGPDARDPGVIKGSVCFEEVVFGYEPQTPVLKGIDLQASPGETIALLGSTGSGKSSIISLIPRFYDPQEGRILIDGLDLKDLKLEPLRRQIGMVLQETFLFSASIRENISYGRPQASLEEVREAARAAQIDDFIQTLPQGYETVVGERGVGLSGGQRQRVAIARALLTDPRILILDDSTSSVDMETEYLIQKALENLRQGRTTFVIAQRLSTIKGADKILVLDEGRIVESGTHRDLLAHGRLYKEIYDLQFAAQEGLIADETASAWGGEVNA